MCGEKIIIESFDVQSKKYKIHRYIALKNDKFKRKI